MHNKTLQFGAAVIFALYISVCAVAAGIDPALLQVWSATNKPIEERLASMRKEGIKDVNDIAEFLDKRRVRNAALNSMIILAPYSRPLEDESLKSVIYLVRYSPVDSESRILGLRLLCNYSTNNQFLNFIAHEAMSFSPQESAYVLGALGEVYERYSSHRGTVINQAALILKYQEIYARGGMPFEGIDAFPVFLSAIKSKQYQESKLADSAARIIFDRMEKGFWRIPSVNFEAAIEFLLNESKANPEYLSMEFGRISSTDSLLAKAVLWKLIEAQSKSNVAKKSIELFLSQSDQNKTLFHAMTERKVTRADGFDSVLQMMYVKPSMK